MVKISNNAGNGKTWLQLTGFLVLFLIAYTWTQPFRDIYGIEARNALMAREMLEGGLSIIPKALGRPYPDYPPLYFWLETLFSLPFGHVSTLSVVLPSGLSAVGLLALTFCLGREIRPRTGWLSALILATIPSFWLEASSATIDMLLAFNVTAGIVCLYFRDTQGHSKRRMPWTMGIILFLMASFFTKGPIGIVLPAVSWGGYLLFETRLKDFVFFELFMMSVGLLCVAIELAVAYHAGGRQLVHDVITMQVVGRLQGKASKPFFYYLISLLEIGSIWWLFIIAGLFRFCAGTPGKGRCLRFWQTLTAHSVTRLTLAWFVGTFTVFTLASTKHARYLLPLYPAIAVILAAWVGGLLKENSPPYSKICKNSAIFLTGALLLAGMSFSFLYPQFLFVPFGCIFIWLVAGAAGAVIVMRWIKERYYLVGSIFLLLAVGLSGTTLMVTPAVSRRASARAFVAAAESRVDPLLPVVIYGISADGDGVKYALYSSRKSATIRFVDTLEALNLISTSCLLITRSEDKTRLQELLSGRNLQQVAEGKIRSKQLCAYLLGAEGESNP